MRYVEGKIDRNQVTFAPMSLDEMISDDNPIRVIDAFVEMLDVKELDFKYSETSTTGRRPYNPKDMLKLYIYGYFNGIRTSRKLERECHRNIELMWLINRLTPDFKTIADFRKDNKKAITSVFREFSLLCDELNLIGKEIVAIDGSKFRASNSRRMNVTKRKIKKMIAHYEQSAQKYIELLANSDGSDNENGKVDLKDIDEKLKRAKKRMEELNHLAKEVEEHGEICLTDPDARHMGVSNNGTDIAHNVQVSVDAKHHLVVAVDVTSNAADNGLLYSMAEQTKQEMSVDKLTVLADKGYYNGKDLKSCEENGITAIVSKQKQGSKTGNDDYAKDKFIYDKEEDTYTCPMGKRLKRVSKTGAKRTRYRSSECNNCPKKADCTTSKKGREISPTEFQEYYDRADETFTENIGLYKQRQMIVEHPFGTVKRSLGYSYFLQRGNENVKCESYMHFFVYNLKRVINIMGFAPLMDAIESRIVKAMQRTSSMLSQLLDIFRFSMCKTRVSA